MKAAYPKIKYQILLLLIGVAFKSVAQQATQYSLVSYNPYQYNVGYAGLANSLEATAVVRKQWLNVQGSPLSQNINAHLPVYYLHGGFGINIDNDQVGAVRTTSATASYCYHVSSGKGNILGLGIGGGFAQQNLDGTKLTTPDGKYSNGGVQHNDNILTEVSQNAVAPIVQMGAYFKTKRIQIGLSANNLTQSYEKYTIKNLKIRFIKNIFCNFAVNFALGKNLTISPTVFLKTDLVQTQIESGLLATISDNYTIGCMVRGYSPKTTDALVIFGSLKLNDKTKLAYGYDLGLSKFNTAQNGSHEILIQYNLNKVIGAGKPEKIIYNPRFL